MFVPPELCVRNVCPQGTNKLFGKIKEDTAQTNGLTKRFIYIDIFLYKKGKLMSENKGYGLKMKPVQEN